MIVLDDADRIFAIFAESLLAFDARAAQHYADVVAERDRHGRPISVLDAQIAGVCRSTDAAIATRNIRDFDGLHLDVIDPWR